MKPTHKITLFMILRGTIYLLSLNLLVFLRWQLGERLMVDLCIACGFSWFCLWLYEAARFHVATLLPEPHLSQFFLFALSALTACHLICMWWRRKKPATVHSFSTGRPLGVWRLLRVSDIRLQRYVQPTVCMLGAIGLWRWDRLLTYWIGAASLAVFIEEQLARFQMRRRVLDTIDGRFDSQTLYGRVQDRLSPVSTTGVQIPVIEITEPSRRKTGKLKNILARLDPELRKMLEPLPEAEKGKPK